MHIASSPFVTVGGFPGVVGSIWLVLNFSGSLHQSHFAVVHILIIMQVVGSFAILIGRSTFGVLFALNIVIDAGHSIQLSLILLA